MNPTKWSYNQALGTDLDKIRFLISDTDDQNKIFDDDEIVGMQGLQGTIFLTAAALADNLSARYAGATGITVDGLAINDSDKARHYADLAARLRQQGQLAAGGLGIPVVGGISLGAMNGVDENIDRTPSRFKVGQDENVRANPIVERQYDPI